MAQHRAHEFLQICKSHQTVQKTPLHISERSPGLGSGQIIITNRFLVFNTSKNNLKRKIFYILQRPKSHETCFPLHICNSNYIPALFQPYSGQFQKRIWPEYGWNRDRAGIWLEQCWNQAFNPLLISWRPQPSPIPALFGPISKTNLARIWLEQGQGWDLAGIVLEPSFHP